MVYDVKTSNTPLCEREVKPEVPGGLTLLLSVPFLGFICHVTTRGQIAAWWGGRGIRSTLNKPRSQPDLRTLISCVTLGKPTWPPASRGHGTCLTPKTDQASVWAGDRAQGTVPAGAVLKHVGALRRSPSIQEVDACPSASNLGPPEYVPQAVQPAGCSGSDKYM